MHASTSHSATPPPMLCYAPTATSQQTTVDGGALFSPHRHRHRHHSNNHDVLLPNTTTTSTTSSPPPQRIPSPTLVSTKSSSPPPTENEGTLQRSSTAGEVNPPPKKRRRASKKISKTGLADERGGTAPPPPIPKAKKEKVGERIATLQQLVSPFGKTDTASVLHEAMGYIRFLQDQIQVLCLPFFLLQHPPTQQRKRELKSRGLCLVPVDWTMHVLTTATNGSDLWSPVSTSIAATATTTAASFPCFLPLPASSSNH